MSRKDYRYISKDKRAFAEQEAAKATSKVRMGKWISTAWRFLPYRDEFRDKLWSNYTWNEDYTINFVAASGQPIPKNYKALSAKATEIALAVEALTVEQINEVSHELFQALTNAGFSEHDIMDLIIHNPTPEVKFLAYYLMNS